MRDNSKKRTILTAIGIIMFVASFIFLAIIFNFDSSDDLIGLIGMSSITFIAGVFCISLAVKSYLFDKKIKDLNDTCGLD